MPTTRCKRFDCEYHGIEVCMIENNVNADCVCITYRTRQPVHIQPSDLRAPFSPNCHKEQGKYKSDKGMVLK